MLYVLCRQANFDLSLSLACIARIQGIIMSMEEGMSNKIRCREFESLVLKRARQIFYDEGVYVCINFFQQKLRYIFRFRCYFDDFLTLRCNTGLSFELFVCHDRNYG